MDTKNRGIIARVADLISRARFVSARLGWTHVPLWLCSTLGRRLSFHILVVWLHATEGPPPGATEQAAGLEARFLTSDEILHFASALDSEYRYTEAFASDAR